MQQSTAEKILKAGKNVFLTGAAGSGKTYLLRSYIQYLKAHSIRVAVTASTGIAATHLDGITIHSWSGLGIREALSENDLRKMMKKKELRERIQKTQVLIIDEISMLSQKTLQCVEEILRHFRSSFEPFGGIQLIVSGDFFQLPPVSKENIPFAQRIVFMSPVWTAAKFEVCYLEEQHRQLEDTLLNLLGEIRSGAIGITSQEKVREKIEAFPSDTLSLEKCTQLFTHNAPADVLNQERLEALKKPIKTFKAKSQGLQKWVVVLRQSMLAPENLQLAVGASVMFVRNNPDKGYFNGTRGVVIDFEEGIPMVETHKGEYIFVTHEDWSIVDENDDALAVVSQIPLRLAWAITVHKSQGMTLERATMDLRHSFEKGQGYVALSRVKTWAGLFLKGANLTTFQIEPLVLKADKRFQELSEQSENAILSDAKNLQELWEAFIKKCGGTLTPKVLNKERTLKKKPLEKEDKKPFSTTFDESLFEKLRGFRNTLAYEEGIAPFRIFSNRTLKDMVNQLPKTRDDLLKIPGIGQRKCDLYGDDFLQFLLHQKK